MLVKLSHERAEALFESFRASEDCEENPDGSFTVDLYDGDPVLSAEVYPDKNGYRITALLKMEYSDELDGWYISDKLKGDADMEIAARRIEVQFQ